MSFSSEIRQKNINNRFILPVWAHLSLEALKSVNIFAQKQLKQIIS